MTIAGYRPRNHPQQVQKNGAVDDVDDRATSTETFEEISAIFGPFSVDVAASAANAKCAGFYTIKENGLACSWEGEAVWCNPPYSGIRPWIEKAWAEYRAFRSATFLLPGTRQEQPWWQDLVEPFRDRCGSPLRSRFLRSRRPFVSPGGVVMKQPPFGVVVLDWRKDREGEWFTGPDLDVSGKAKGRAPARELLVVAP